MARRSKRPEDERYTIGCTVCGEETIHAVGTPFPPVERLVCARCGTSQAKPVLERVMGSQYSGMKKLGKWILLVTLPSAVVLVIGVWLFLNPQSRFLSEGLAIFLIISSTVLLAMALSFYATLRWRRRLLEKLAAERQLNMVMPEDKAG